MRFGKCGGALLLVALGGCFGDILPPGSPRTVTLIVDFDRGFQGWVADVSDYSESEADIIDFEARIADLPEEISATGRGYLVTSSNRSDDLFVFLKRQL